MSLNRSSIGYAGFCFMLFFALLMPGWSRGQSQGIAQEVLEYKDTVKEVIANGRRLIAKKLEDGDIEKVKEVKRYLTTGIDNRGYLSFMHTSTCLFCITLRNTGSCSMGFAM